MLVWFARFSIDSVESRFDCVSHRRFNNQTQLSGKSTNYWTISLSTRWDEIQMTGKCTPSVEPHLCDMYVYIPYTGISSRIVQGLGKCRGDYNNIISGRRHNRLSSSTRWHNRKLSRKNFKIRRVHNRVVGWLERRARYWSEGARLVRSLGTRAAQSKCGSGGGGGGNAQPTDKCVGPGDGIDAHFSRAHAARGRDEGAWEMGQRAGRPAINILVI